MGLSRSWASCDVLALPLVISTPAKGVLETSSSLRFRLRIVGEAGVVLCLVGICANSESNGAVVITGTLWVSTIFQRDRSDSVGDVPLYRCIWKQR